MGHGMGKVSGSFSPAEGGFIVVGQIHLVGQIFFSRKFPTTVKPVFRAGHFGGQGVKGIFLAKV